MKKITRILVLAALLSLAHSVIASSAEPPKGKSITLGDLTFSDRGTKDVKGKGALDLEAGLIVRVIRPSQIDGPPVVTSLAA